MARMIFAATDSQQESNVITNNRKTVRIEHVQSNISASRSKQDGSIIKRFKRKTCHLVCMTAIATAIATTASVLTILWLNRNVFAYPNAFYALQPVGAFGGEGGYEFNDAAFVSFGAITALRIRHDDVIIGIQVRYGKIWAPYHGDRLTAGKLSEVVLKKDEMITVIHVRCASLVDQLTIITNKWVYGPYGKDSGLPYSARGKQLRFISGKCAQSVDRITFWFDQ